MYEAFGIVSIPLLEDQSSPPFTSTSERERDLEKEASRVSYALLCTVYCTYMVSCFCTCQGRLY